jgi:hypothetical protein
VSCSEHYLPSAPNNLEKKNGQSLMKFFFGISNEIFEETLTYPLVLLGKINYVS